MPAVVPEGGQRTSDDGGEIPTNAKPAQYTGRERSTLAEILLSKGGENLGSFGDRVSVVKGRNISHQESYDPRVDVLSCHLQGLGRSWLTKMTVLRCEDVPIMWERQRGPTKD